MKSFKKMIALLICLILSLGTFANAEEAVLISAPPARDYEGHWAQATIQKWLDAGKVSGYPDGSYKPDSNVTRAEFVKMVNGIIDFNKKAVITYKDVSASEWFYDYIGVAQEVGYISGYSSDKFGPNDYITREQAASILSRIQYLDNNESALNKFADNLSISAWAKGSVGAASNSGFISGYTDGSFKPVNNLTRAEALTMIDNVMVNSKNYIVYNAGTILKDTVVEGDLIIAKTVGEGDVHLTNIEVKGGIKVFGGGMNSIYFNNVKVAKIIVEKDKVRLVFDEGSALEEIVVTSEVVLENEDGTIAKITVTGDHDITLKGKFDEITVTGTGNLVLDDAVIANLVVVQPIVIQGTGTVKTLQANSDGIKFEADVKIEKIKLGTGVTVEPEKIGEVISGGGGTGGVPAPKPKLKVTLETTGSDSIAFNTSEYTENDSIYDALVGILNDDTYKTVISSKLSAYGDKLNDMQIGSANGISEIWDKVISYLPETIDLTGLKEKFIDGIITIDDINDLLEAYEEVSPDELQQIIANLQDLDINNTVFKYNGKTVTYAISETGTGTIPSTNLGIAEFIISDVLKSNMSIGDFFNSYGKVTITSTLSGDPVKTTKIILEWK